MFWTAVRAVFPFLVFISLGYGTRRSGFADEEFLYRLNGMLFRVFAPIMMFYNVINIRGGFLLRPGFVLLAAGSLLALEGVLLLVMPKIIREKDPRVTATLAMFWSNNLLFGIPMTQSIFGAEAVPQATLLTAIIIPMYNTTGTMILARNYGEKSRGLSLVKNIVTNPPIMGTLAGIAWLLLGIPLPELVKGPVGQLSGCFTPMAIFVLGGTLHFSSLRRHLGFVSAVLSAKLLLLPAVLAAACLALHLTKLENFMLFTMYATPVGAVTYSVTSAMGGDGELAGEMVVMSTAASIVTIFLWILIFGRLGLL